MDRFVVRLDDMMTNHPLAKLHVAKDRVDLDNVGYSTPSLPLSPFLFSPLFWGGSFPPAHPLDETLKSFCRLCLCYCHIDLS